MTELIWDGKYRDGKKVAPPRIALPFQTIETVNESAAQRQHTLDLFYQGRPTEWRNRLIWGDKSHVLPSLLPEFAGKVNLIYIDPPFDTGANFSYLATVPEAPQHDSTTARQHGLKPHASPSGVTEAEADEDTPAPGQGVTGLSFVKEPSVIEQKAYRDTWGKGLDSYLKWFYETVVLLRELLADDGSIYVHLDHHVSHYAKAVLDEVFGADNFKNEVIWKRTFNSGSSKALANKLPVSTDSIFWYTKTLSFIYNKQYLEYSEGALKRYDKIDQEGKRFKWNPLKTVSAEKLERLIAAGDAKIVPTSKYPIYKHYLDLDKGSIVDNLWADLAHIGTAAEERVQYATQKPENLLERVLTISSNPGDLVLDCFCGSGTTAAVAEKLGRRWITCDLGRFAIHTARKRFLAIENVKPFIVQNLGKYERQAWQTAEFGADAEAITHSYRTFILELYQARPITGYIWLHGVKSGRMVHVGGVDAPISVGDVAQIAAEFKRSRGTGENAPTQNSVDILGWDFAFELNEVSKQQAAQAGVDVRFIRIPREVLEKKAVEQGDIKFFELAALSVDVTQSGRGVTLTLKDFVIPLDDVPQDIQAAITHWEQWIDYWAVDWDNKGDTFHNQWQDYRTRKNKTLQKTIVSPPGTYPEPGEYKVVIKVIDILGNDTTKTVKVQVK